MERVELLIDEVRGASQNTRYDADSGVLQAQMVRYLKNAQDVIVRKVQNTKSKYFITDKTIPTVNAQELYSYPRGIYMQAIDTLEYSYGGTSQGWIFLTHCYTKDRDPSFTGYAFGYILREDGFLLTPPVQGGGLLRINYIRDLPLPQVRQGLISAVTVAGGQVTAMTLNVADSSFDAAALAKQNFLCVVSSDGNQKVRGLKYTSIDAGTGVVTMPAFTLEDGESISVGDYICTGKNVTNLIELPQTCESFLILHATYQAKYGDSSAWTAETKADMSVHLNDLLTSFGRPSDDLSEIPITSVDYLNLF